jgi:hypothetical protein
MRAQLGPDGNVAAGSGSEATFGTVADDKTFKPKHARV